MLMLLYIDVCMSFSLSIYAALYIGISFSVYEKGETSAAIMLLRRPHHTTPTVGRKHLFCCYFILLS